MRTLVFGSAIVLYLLTVAAIAAVFVLLGFEPWQAALIVALGLAMSSDAVAVGTLEERGEAGTPHGRAAMAVVISQGFVAVPVLAAIPMLEAGTSGTPGLPSPDKVLMVLAIIGSRTLARGRIDGMSYDRFMTLERPDEEPPPINLQSIADASGIPRETVRRKVKDLEHAGWVIRRDNGYVIASAGAAHDLAPATEATLRYLATVVTACNAAIADREPPS